MMAKGGGSIVPVVLLSISLLGCGCNGFAPSDLPRHHCYQPLKPHTLSSATRTNGEEQLLSASSDTGATDSIESFANDIEKVLKGTRAEDLDYTVSASFRNRRLSFTNIWTKDMWDDYTSRFRYLRYIYSIPFSRLLMRVLPQLMVLTTWSVLAVVLCSRELGILERLQVPLTPLSLVSTFVAALLTFRSNQGLARLTEGRLAWGQAVLYTREMAMLVAAYIYPKDPIVGLQMARHLSLFGWTLKAHVRQSDEDDIVETMLSGNSGDSSVDARYVRMQRKPPVGVLVRLRQYTAEMWDRGLLAVPQHNMLGKTTADLSHVLTTCERIQATPIPPIYTGHTSRLLVLYLLLLPLSLHQLNAVATVLLTTTVGYAMLGLDEISHLLEEPFRLMPLYQLSKISMLDVADAFVMQPPPLPKTPTSAKSPNSSSSNDSYKLTEPTYW